METYLDRMLLQSNIVLHSNEVKVPLAVRIGTIDGKLQSVGDVIDRGLLASGSHEGVLVAETPVVEGPRASESIEEKEPLSSDEAKRVPPSSLSTSPLPESIYISCQIYNGSGRALSMPISTNATLLSQDGTYVWDEWVYLPVYISDLPLDAMLCLTCWSCVRPQETRAVGGTTVPLFNQKRHTLKSKGKKLFIWQGREADGSANTTTPGKLDAWWYKEMVRLEKLAKRCQPAGASWLDNLYPAQKRRIEEKLVIARGDAPFLSISLPAYEYPIVYSDIEKAHHVCFPNNEQLIISDPASEKENLYDIQHTLLSRKLDRASVDKNLRPSESEDKELMSWINCSPIMKLESRAQDLIWKFRFYLRKVKGALPIVLRSTQWKDESEKASIMWLLKDWGDVDPSEVLELLTGDLPYPEVWDYARNMLDKADSQSLCKYLLQLVQAMRYDPERMKKGSHNRRGSPFQNFLISRAVKDLEMGVLFFWYVKVEEEDELYSQVMRRFRKAMERLASQGDKQASEVKHALKLQVELVAMMEKLVYWVNEQKANRKEKEVILRRVLSQDPAWEYFRNLPEPVPLPFDPLVRVSKVIPEKSKIFKSKVAPIGIFFVVDSVRSPSDVHAKPAEDKHKAAKKEGQDEATAKKGSSWKPRKAESSRRWTHYALRPSKGGVIGVLFKTEDDIRQDQFILQMINLIDDLLQERNLDLKLTPYRGLATAKNAGMLQLVADSTNVASINDEYTAHLEAQAVKNARESHWEKEALFDTYHDTFTRSCAGYCVISYLYGFGDRHLDNILLCSRGHLFHIDFGFIFGSDPKAGAPPIRITKEMSACIEKKNKVKDFEQFIGQAYRVLRQHGRLFIVLLQLMKDSKIEHFMKHTKKDAPSGALDALGTFEGRLDLANDDAAAEKKLLDTVERSKKNFMVVVHDVIHNVAQTARA